MNTVKARALATFINAPINEIEEVSEAYGAYRYQDQAFLVLDDEEADEAVKDTLEMQLGEELTAKVSNMHKLTQEVIEAKGRGPYLAADEEENDEKGWLIYRVN